MIDKLLTHSFAYGVTTIASRATLVVSMIVLPFFLAPAEYGALSMIMTMTALVNVLVPLEITQGLARHHILAPASDRPVYASTAWWFTLAALLAFVAGSEILAARLCGLILGDSRYLEAFRLALVTMALSHLFYFLQCQFRWEFRARDFAVLSLLFSLLTLGLSLGLAMTFADPFLGVIVGQAAAAAITVLLGAWMLRGSFAAIFDWRKLKQMLRFSLPLVPASASVFLTLYASRLILNAVGSLEEVGLFTFGSQVAGIATLTIVGVQAALQPLVMKHYEEPATPRTVARLFETFVGFALCFCLLLGFFAPDLVLYFGNPAYRDSGSVVLIMSFALVVGQLYIFSPGFMIQKKTILQMWVSIGSALFGILANFVLIHVLGMVGASWATLTTSLMFFGLWFSLGQRFYPIPVNWRPISVAVAATAIAGLLGLLVSYPGLQAALLAKVGLLLVVTSLVIATGLVPLRAILAGIAKNLGPRVDRPVSGPTQD